MAPIWRAASSPFMTGIERSRRTTSGWSSRTISTATFPFSASPHISQLVSASMQKRRERRMAGASSTTRIFVAMALSDASLSIEANRAIQPILYRRPRRTCLGVLEFRYLRNPILPYQIHCIAIEIGRSQNAPRPTRRIAMAYLTLQEVTERITKSNPLAKQLTHTRLEDQPHRPEFYVPRLTRRLANLKFSGLTK